jgi:hypothetical protein
MNKKYPIILSILFITIVSACGPAPEPTLAAADIADTAVADAWMAITQTAAAMPTATATETPLPPSQTPLPTFTFLPTLAPVTAGSTAVAGAATQDPCNQPPAEKPKGTLITTKFLNKSGGVANFSFGMMKPNEFGECFTYTYYINKFDEVTTPVLTGCYWGYAWITGKEPSIARTGKDFICLTDTSKVLTIWVESESIWIH